MKDKYPHLKDSIRGKKIGNKCMDLNILLESETYVYLKEHVFGDMSFVPATMIMELLCEVGLYYCDETKIPLIKNRLYHIKDFQVLRGLTIAPGNSLEFDIKLEVTSLTKTVMEFSICIFSNRLNKNGIILSKKINVTSKLLIDFSNNKKKTYSAPRVNWTMYDFNIKELYNQMFPSLGFHFQTIQNFFNVDSNYKFCYGEYNLQDKEATSIIGNDINFITSPLGNDASIQIAVFYSRLINGIGRLPIGGSEIIFYKKPPTSGSVSVVIECLSINADMQCNIVIYDEKQIYVEMSHFLLKKSPYHKKMTTEEINKWISKFQISLINKES